MTPLNKPTKSKKQARTSRLLSPEAQGPQFRSPEPSSESQGAGTATGFWLALELPPGNEEDGLVQIERSCVLGGFVQNFSDELLT